MTFRKENLQLPKLVKPCPIVEATCEVRFTPSVPSDAVFGASFAKLAHLVGKPMELPILTIPPNIRNTDPNLLYQPYYRFQSSDVAVQLGPRVFSVSVTEPYPGWSRFAPAIKERVSALIESNVIEHVSRFGLRYINFIEGDVFDKIDVTITANGKEVAGREMSLSVIVNNRYPHIVRIRKDVNVKVGSSGSTRFGSVIDIDTFMDKPKGGLGAFDTFLEESHIDEKTVFFGMLKTDYLATLSPTY